MRLDKPRVAPLADEEIDPEIRERFGPDGPVLEHLPHAREPPGLMKRWLVFGNHVLGKSTLPAREREIAILRIGWLCRSGYEWGQHVRDRQGARASPTRRSRASRGRRRERLERARARAAARDRRAARGRVRLRRHLGGARAARSRTQQLMDLVFTVGQYNLVSMALNSFGVQPEPGPAALPRP